MSFFPLSSHRWFPVLLLPLVLSLANCSMIFPVLAPFSDLPPPTGPYAVATRHATWIDSSRDETFTAATDFRKIVVQVWYPIPSTANLTPLPYIDDPELRLPALARQLRLPQSLIDHFSEVKTHSVNFPDPPDSEKQYPIILFSHGLSGMRFQNTALIEELVSYGYVVLAADHSYGANITIFEDGSVAEYRVGKRRSLNEDFLSTIDLTQLGILVGDLRFILDKISDHPGDPLLENLPLDPDRIGIVGHSLGGAAAINTMAVDERVAAALILDGWYAPVPDSIVSRGLDNPFFHIGQKAWSNPENYARMDELLMHSSGPVYKMLVPGTLHTDFTDMPLFTPFSYIIGYTAAKDPVWLDDLIRINGRTFFDVYLKQHPESELEDEIRHEKDVISYIFVP